MANQDFLTDRQKVPHFLLVSFCRRHEARHLIELQRGSNMKKSRFIVAVLASCALIVAACGGSDSDSIATEAPSTEAPSTDAPVTEERTASDIGVTADTIKIGVAISDLEAIRAMGISIPETLTTAHLFDRWDVFVQKWNAAGGINGRMIELFQLVWNPLDPSTFDTLCAAATVDNELFMVINGTVLSSVARKCLLDAGMPIMYGDVMSLSELETGLAISLAAPAEVIGSAGVNAWIGTPEAVAGSTVGILSNNSPAVQAAGKAAEQTLIDAGFTVHGKHWLLDSRGQRWSYFFLAGHKLVGLFGIWSEPCTCSGCWQ